MPVERFLEDDCNGTSRVSFSYLDLFKYQQNDRSTRGRCTRPLITFFLLNNMIIAFICSVCLCRDCTINNNKDLQRLLGGGENESKRGIRKMPV